MSNNLVKLFILIEKKMLITSKMIFICFYSMNDNIICLKSLTRNQKAFAINQ